MLIDCSEPFINTVGTNRGIILHWIGCGIPVVESQFRDQNKPELLQEHCLALRSHDAKTWKTWWHVTQKSLGGVARFVPPNLNRKIVMQWPNGFQTLPEPRRFTLGKGCFCNKTYKVLKSSINEPVGASKISNGSKFQKGKWLNPNDTGFFSTSKRLKALGKP